MKIVVTGALGHIGSRLIRELPQRFPGAEVVMIDNFLVQRYPSLFNLPEQGRYHFLEGDVTTMSLAQVVAGAAAVVHLAAITDAASSIDNREQVERNNFSGTRNVGEACFVARVPLICLSTTSVYGTQGALVDESCSEAELKPQSPYAETKLREEKLLAELGSKGLEFVTCRFGTIFGTSPGMRFHTAVNRFCWQAVMGQPITVWRTALHQTRPYLDLADGVNAIGFIIEKQIFDRRIYNVVTLNATVHDIVSAIRKKVPDLRIEQVDSRIMNQLSYEVSMERFKSRGFEFRGDLPGGISDTIELLRGARFGCTKRP